MLKRTKRIPVIVELFRDVMLACVLLYGVLMGAVALASTLITKV